MQTQAKEWGNSQGIRLPKEIISLIQVVKLSDVPLSKIQH